MLRRVYRKMWYLQIPAGQEWTSLRTFSRTSVIEVKDDIVQKLIDEGHDVDGRITRFGMTPLYFAFTNCADKSSKGIYRMSWPFDLKLASLLSIQYR